MKQVTKLAAGIAASALSLSAAAQITGADTLAGFEFSNASASAQPIQGVSAVAIAGDLCVIEGLQKLQGMDAACHGDTDVSCAPTISSAELASILTGRINGANALDSADSDLLAESACTKNVMRFTGIGTNTENYAYAAASELVNANAQVGGFQCGQGTPVKTANQNRLNGAANAAAALTVLDTADDFFHWGLLPATELANASANVGFVKLDGVAPSLTALLSGNYNLVTNLHRSSAVSVDGEQVADTKGITVGIAAAGNGSGVPYHALASGTAVDCAPVVNNSANDVNGGAI